MIPADAARETPDVKRLRELAEGCNALYAAYFACEDADDGQFYVDYLAAVARLNAEATPDVVLALCATLEERERLLAAFVAWDDEQEEMENPWDVFDTLCNDARAALPTAPPEDDHAKD